LRLNLSAIRHIVDDTPSVPFDDHERSGASFGSKSAFIVGLASA